MGDGRVGTAAPSVGTSGDKSIVTRLTGSGIEAKGSAKTMTISWSGKREVIVKTRLAVALSGKL
jgi:hypothetical protein